MAAIASTTTSTALVSARSGRFRIIIENSDANRLYVLIGSGTASSSNYSFSLAQYENATIEDQRDEVSGVWEADGSGYALVTVVA